MNTITIQITEVLNELYKQKLEVSSHYHIFENPIGIINTFASKPTSINELKLPLRIHGRLITAGTYPEENDEIVIFTPEELKKSVFKWNGIPGYDSHAVHEAVMRGQNTSVRGVVAKIIQTFWNEKDQAIDFEADVFDPEIAFKIIHGLIRNVSVGYKHGIKPLDKLNGYEAVNMKPLEWSFVLSPRDKNAVIQPMGY